MRLSISRRAQNDLDAIWVFIATESGNTEIADRVLDSISGAFRILRRTPFIGRNRGPDLQRDLRSHAVGNYVIFYRIESSDVRIVRILHGRRDIPAVLSGL